MGPLALRAGCMARDTETPCLTCGRSQTRPARPPPQPLPCIIVSDNPSRGSRRSAEKRVHDLSLPRRRVEELSTPAEIRLRFASFKHGDNNMKIYLAGPLFSAAERTFNNELTRLLRNKGHEVWLPQEFEQRTMTAKQIFNKDVEGIDWAEVVVANMDGPDPDSGTCWECGYAYRKKPVILFRTDFRAGYKLRGHLPQREEQSDPHYNLMLTEAATKRLDLPFAALDSIDDVLQNFRPAT